jgi:hypothetical protein
MALDSGQLGGFIPKDHLIQIKNKGGAAEYLPVQWRLVWVNAAADQASIEGKEVDLDIDCQVIAHDPVTEYEAETYAWNNETRRSEKVTKRAPGSCTCEARVALRIGNITKRARMQKTERGVDFPDYVEKAGTGAVGRALAAIGYGTQFAPELDEQHRIVDAPVGGQSASVAPAATSAAPTPAGDPTTATVQQIASIRKLCEHLGRQEPTGLEAMTYAQAKNTIAQLSGEYRQMRKAG